MPWYADDAPNHTHKANTPYLRRLWAKTANSDLEKHHDDGRAIRIANAAVARARNFAIKKSHEFHRP